jgi:hypothetical protein
MPKEINFRAATAVIRRLEVAGEPEFSARVMAFGRTLLRLEERPSEQSVCLDVLDWARRHGRELEWEYRK